ncbi:MAG: response regulator, partial [Acidobacteriota bacterium]|nr:response regulator [Acidobacteriota bacterium]
MKILLVEDDILSSRMLERSLTQWQHEVICAGNGAEGLAVLRSDPDVSMVISDWHMPSVDGEELCREVRSMDRDRYVPVILLTSFTENMDVIRGMEAGADAFLTKPLKLPELRAYMRVAERVIGLERRLEEKVAELDKVNRAMQEDLNSAGRIQRSLLPHVPLTLPQVETGWAFDACTATAGDMLNVVRLDEHRVGMYVLDVSGHGTQAALLSVSLSRVLTPYTQQGGLLKRSKPGGYHIPSPGWVAGELNRRFPVMRQSGQYFTFIYGILDFRDNSFVFVRAGHPPLIHVSGGKVIPYQGVTNVPIGWLKDVA